jgi:hypothetical protein
MQYFKKAVPTMFALLAGFVGGSIGTAIQADSAQGAPDEIVTSRLVIVDDDGKVRGNFGVFDGIAGLILNGANEKPRVMMNVEADGTPLIALLDDDGNIRLGMDVGNSGIPQLILSRSDMTAAITLTMTVEGLGVIMIKDESGKVVWLASPPLE